jgi:hypothetical protein
MLFTAVERVGSNDKLTENTLWRPPLAAFEIILQVLLAQRRCEWSFSQ